MSLLKSIKKNVSVTMCITLLFSLFIVYPASASTFFQDRFEEGGNLWTSTSGNWTIVEDEGNSVYYQSVTKKDVLLQVIQPGAITLWKRM